MGADQEKIIEGEKYHELLKNTLKSIPTDQVLEVAAISRARNDPLPGPAFDAVSDDGSRIKISTGEIVLVRPAVAYDFVIFKKLNSPIHQMILEASSKEKDNIAFDFNEESMYELIFQFTRSCKDVRLVLKKGKEYFTEEAMSQIADKFNLDDVRLVVENIIKNIHLSFSSMIAHDVPNKDGNVVEKKT
jgi:hypothetical protein